MMLSGDAAKAEAGLRYYQPHTPDIQRAIGSLPQHYGIGRTGMSYAMADFRRENLRKGLKELTVEERLAGLSPDEVLHRFSSDEVLSHLSPEQIESYLRRHKRDQDEGHNP